MNSEPIIELRDVAVPTRSDAESVSIDGLNWAVRKNEFWVVGGLQGSGKSDLLLLLAGLNRPVSGDYTLFGQDMTRHFSDEFLPCRLRVGLVFDDARLFNHLTISENIALPVRYHNDLHADESEAWVSALLKATELTEFATNTPGALTRSWRRRAALARALALRPEVLMLENPLRGLDARHTAWWIDFVDQLWRGHELMRGEPVTVILSTDEFRPWRESGAKFAMLDSRKFVIIGEHAPEDELRLPRVAAEERI
jgi:ABC-type transporter Mla maintaining outer membrane lipid asymmetry ATPase subunit MlaF